MGTKERPYHHGDLRRALLDAALQLVDQSGVSAVTMSAVARRAEVSSGAPYRHFEDRFALLQALRRRAEQVVAERMQEAARAVSDPLEGFARAGVEYVCFAVDEPALFRVLTHVDPARDSPGSRDPLDGGFTQALGARLCADDGVAPLDPRDPLIQQLAARCLMHGLAHFFADGHHRELGIGLEQAPRIATALTRALGPPSFDPPSQKS